MVAAFTTRAPARRRIAVLQISAQEKHAGPARPTSRTCKDPSRCESPYDRFQWCYGQALGRDPEARGNVTVRFAIQPSGSAEDACLMVAELEDGEAVQCVLYEFEVLEFEPQAEEVTVIYPIEFVPRDNLADN